MKILFLDIDGVLNNEQRYDEWRKQPKKGLLDIDFLSYLICPQRLLMVKRIIEETGAKIVLSSSWRNLPEDKNIVEHRLAEIGLELWSCTGSCSIRRKEILEWLETREIEKYAILDDDPHADVGDRKDGKWFQTIHEGEALTDEIADAVIEWLNN